MAQPAVDEHVPLATAEESGPDNKTYRSDPRTVTPAELIRRHKVNPKLAEGKARDIQVAVSILDQNEPFPGVRPYRDAFCIPPVLLMCLLVFGGAVNLLCTSREELLEAFQEVYGPSSNSPMKPSQHEEWEGLSDPYSELGDSHSPSPSHSHSHSKQTDDEALEEYYRDLEKQLGEDPDHLENPEEWERSKEAMKELLGESGSRLLSESHSKRAEKSKDLKQFNQMIRTLGIGAAASTGSSVAGCLAFLFVCRIATEWIVWTSIFVMPFMMLCMGAVLCLAGMANPVGALFIIVGCCMFTCFEAWWKQYVPFTSRVLAKVSEVMTSQPKLVLASFACCFLQIVWSACTWLAFASLYLAVADPSDGPSGIWVFGLGFFLYTGWCVCKFVCYVTYAGVFGRWYYQESNNSFVANLKVACTTSFGSICFASLTLGLLETLEMMARAIRRNAQEGGNILACVLAMILECFIGCLGSLLEWLTEWAMVHVAVRGVNLVDGGRIFTSQMLCSNTQMVFSDLLLRPVMGLGTLFCGLVAAASGGFAGYALSPDDYSFWLTGVLGLIIGISVARVIVDPVNMGSKTIISLWAEDPQPIMEMDPALHGHFESTIQSKM